MRVLDWLDAEAVRGARMNVRRLCVPTILICSALLLAGCRKGGMEYSAGDKAESLNDYDTALDHFNKALRAAPNNTEYKLKAARARFEAGQWHVDQGRKMRDQGNLVLALAEFQKAQMIDPSSAVAQQEVRATTDAIATQQGTTQNAPPAGAPSEEPQLMTGPPKVEPLSRSPINMKATNDSKAVFEAIGKLAGLTIIFDPDFTSRRVSVELTNVTLEQALNITALQSKAFWRPVTSNIIFVAPDQPQKRKDYEEEIVKTFYLHNTVLPQELTEIVTSIRQLLDLRRVQQINAQNAIVIRDTPDRVLLAGKIIDDIDKAKPEVVIQVAVMQARRDRLRNIGITPPQSISAAFANPSTTNTTSTTGTATNGAATISQLIHTPNIYSAGYAITMPGATANFLMTDTSTQIIDDPEIRVVDGQTAKLRVGDRVPVATGSFQAGIGVGATGVGAGVVNPLVNTQFQYLDVGVNVDVTPRIHPDHEISMKVNVVVSSVTGEVNLGGINQPIISQRSIEHDIRLKDGEVSVLGGLIERTDTDTVNGIPGLARVPLFRYFFANDQVDHQENEVLIVLIPHIVRLPSISADNLRSIASGTDTNAEVRLADVVMAPSAPSPQAAPPAPAASGAPAPPAAPAAEPAASQNATLRFEPGTATLKAGETTTIGVVVQNVQDLYSIPMLVQFNPAVISVEDVRQGGFLSGGTQEVAIVERVDKERGQAIISATRMPNTPGVSGSGTLVGIVVKGVAPGNSQLSIVQVNAKDSQQRPIQMVTGEAAVRVQ